MKQTVQDRQVQRTRQLLLDALIDLIVEQGYEKTTVQDIIDRANVGRTTFYSHFRDKQDLLLSGFEKLDDVFENFRADPAQESLWDFSLALFRHAADQRRVFKALFEKQSRGLVLFHFEQATIVYFKERFQATLRKKKPPVPLDVLARYLLSAFLGLLTWWLENDLSWSAEQMNEYFRRLAEPTMQTLLAKQ